MKIALYIQDGLEQVVLTPESKTEKDILGKLHDGSRDLSVLRGSFFQCRGGWVRQGADDDSTMIVLRSAPPKPSPDAPITSGSMDLGNLSGIAFTDDHSEATS